MNSLKSSSRLSKSSTTLNKASVFSPIHSPVNQFSPARIKSAASQANLETIDDIFIPKDELLVCDDLTRLPLLYDSTGNYTH